MGAHGSAELVHDRARGVGNGPEHGQVLHVRHLLRHERPRQVTCQDLRVRRVRGFGVVLKSRSTACSLLLLRGIFCHAVMMAPLTPHVGKSSIADSLDPSLLMVSLAAVQYVEHPTHSGFFQFCRDTVCLLQAVCSRSTHASDAAKPLHCMSF